MSNTQNNNFNDQISVEKQTLLIEQNLQLQSENTYLRHELDKLKRMIFGARSERFESNVHPSQLLLGFNAPQESTELQKEIITYERNKSEKKEKAIPIRQAIPAHLPREIITLEPENKAADAVKIGEEITEVMEYKPGTIYVKKYVRPKYAAKSTENIAIAELPSLPIPKSTAGASLLAHIEVSKFVDHLPFYRQRQIFKRQGVDIAPSTIDGWSTATCKLITPLYDALKKKILESDYLQADEVPIPVLTEDKPGATHKGYLWTYRSPVLKLVCFDYNKSRGQEAPTNFLKDFKGALQTDGYAVYNSFEKRSDIKLLSCMTHARRYFDEAMNSDQKKATEMLSLMQPLYKVEQMARDHDLPSTERMLLRIEKSKPALVEIEKWIKETTENYNILPQSPIGKAISYTQNLWPRLIRYIDDGRYEIDNNLIENRIRPVTLGRKNYLFAGSHEGAKRAAMMYSFFGTCKENDIEPLQWLTDVLIRISEHKANQLVDLLPIKKS